MKIQLILGSTRNGRLGKQVAEWVFGELKNIPTIAGIKVNVEMLDLLKWNLPMYQEPFEEAVNKWKAKVAEADGYIIVTPEYNHGYPAVLKNALDYPSAEWNKKPVAFVGYSDGMSAGIRSVEQLRLVCIQLQMAPIRRAMYFPEADKNFVGGRPKDPASKRRLLDLLDELVWWAYALKSARETK